jgi:hypothetical protein
MFDVSVKYIFAGGEGALIAAGGSILGILEINM